MADELDALLERVDDAGLRSELRSHIERLRRRRQFGLVFESHLPERVRLPDHPIRRGSKVVRRDAPPKETPQEVLRIKGKKAVLADDGDEEQVACDDLVVVAEFGEPIYPGLRRLGSIDRGGDKPAHVVIKGENYHALEALRFSHAGKVDCIYIDPPYNTGARDWKYDNDYVDDNDDWRHSKWLSFMNRRLRLAKDLLRPDGVLIVTIDEHEVHHLAMLLEQLFPEARRPMVTIVMNSAGNTQNGFYRVEEHAIFCFPPGVGPARIPDDLLADEGKKPRSLWGTHIRSGGINDRPSKRPNLVYPIAIAGNGEFVGTGRSLEERLESGELNGFTRGELDDWRPDPAETIDGHPVQWPWSKDGSLGTWRNDADTFGELVDAGFVRIRPNEAAPGTNTFSISYVTSGNRKKVEDGTIPTLGREPGGALILGSEKRPVIPKTVWKRRLHDATNWGSPILTAFVGPNPFTYPKSPYATQDTLATVVADRPEAVILDFFAGSGTTLHSTCMLNAADGGTRQSILVTNNEVGAEDAARLRAEGHRPADAEWESKGIFEQVTRRRCEAVITGRRPDGEPVEGEYDDGRSYSDGFDENIDFVELKYLDIEDVELDLAFESIAPLLWLRAGGCGPVVDKRCDASGDPKAFDLTDRYGVLFDPDHWREFVEKLAKTATTVFVVTDSPSVFASVAAELPSGVDVVRLYENYLSTFAINRGR